jgi:prepilin-type processing-associated H-X9-DG protein
MRPDTSTPDTPEVRKRTFADSAVSISAWLAVASTVAFAVTPLVGHYADESRTLAAAVAIVVSLLGVLASLVAILAAVTSNRRVSVVGPLLALLICAWFTVLSLNVFVQFAKAPAHQAPSASNIRRLALAVQQYSNDYDGALPGWLNVGTKQSPQYVHNVWDRQIDPFVKSKDVYYPPQPEMAGPGVRSPSSGQRVIGYALNGALIAPYVNGNVDWSKQQVLSASTLSNPANTILFAEIVTRQPMGGKYADPGVPGPPKGPVSKEWTKAITQRIDIDPKAWVETSGPVDSYESVKWDATRGIARDLYGGGGFYAFCDGHVAFQKLEKTTTSGQDIAPGANWSPTEQAGTIQFNQWYPG